MILINGFSDDRIDILDRAVQYGDGLFETIAYRNSQAEFLDLHLNRLLVGCHRLKIPFKELEQLKSELRNVFSELSENDAVIKIIVSRGQGGRGYLADPLAIPTRIISTHPLPLYPKKNDKTGIITRFCQQRLAENTSLAGVKHLNRLEQVLARNEWHDSEIAEGIMLDQHDQIIEGTMSNLFVIKSGKIYTAQIDKCGVAGIIRAEIIKLAQTNDLICEETVISKKMLADADEVFVCNSIIHIWPVIRILDTEINYNYAIGNITRQLQHLLSSSIKYASN